MSLTVLTPRHLQNSDSPTEKLVFYPKRLRLYKKDQSLHCRLRLKTLDLYKSIYCFKKIKKKEGLQRPSWVLTTSNNPPKPIYSDAGKTVVFSSMTNWGTFYFLGCNSEKGT